MEDIERRLVEEVEKTAGRSVGELALEALVEAAKFGIPVEPRLLDRRTLLVRVRGEARILRATARLSGDPPGYWVALTLFGTDRGDVALVHLDGKVEPRIEHLPGYLSATAELLSAAEADVWIMRIQSATEGHLEEADSIPEGYEPETLLRRAYREAGIEWTGKVKGRIRLFYCYPTSDYVVDVEGVKPVWANKITETLTYSPLALRLIMG